VTGEYAADPCLVRDRRVVRRLRGDRAGGVGYTNYVQSQARHRTEAERAESDRRWCALLTELDNAYATSPGPTTEVGKKVAAEIHQLRVGLGCPER
jgi:hypothetical protein